VGMARDFKDLKIGSLRVILIVRIDFVIIPPHIAGVKHCDESRIAIEVICQMARYKTISDANFQWRRDA